MFCVYLVKLKMTNLITVNVDTERSQQILIGKPSDFPQPESREEAAKMILNDISCLSQALKLLIVTACDSKYADKNELTVAVVNTIYEALQENEQENENK